MPTGGAEVSDPVMAHRILGVVYILSEGRVGVEVQREEILTYVNKHGVHLMTDEAWKAHVRPHTDRIRAARTIGVGLAYVAKAGAA